MLVALTRAVSPSIDLCELTNLQRIPIDLELAEIQHHSYEAALSTLGVEVHSLPAEPGLPDAVFVEDAAVVLDECAILTRPGAASRRPEVDSIRTALAPYRKLFTISSPGTLDGGDVLVAGKDIYIGISARSNQAAIEQVQQFLASYGYRIHAVPVTGCLHLKSAVTQVAEDTLLINPRWVERELFPAMGFIEVDASEHYGANALKVGQALIYQPAYPATLQKLRAAGFQPLLVDQSELAKAEGALTCCSLLFTV